MSDIGKLLIDAILSKDAKQTLMQIQQFKENMRNKEVGAEYVMWITEPVNLTNIHSKLVEILGIPPRLLSIRRMEMNRTQKAVLLVQAMENALKRVCTT